MRTCNTTEAVLQAPGAACLSGLPESVKPPHDVVRRGAPAMPHAAAIHSLQLRSDADQVHLHSDSLPSINCDHSSTFEGPNSWHVGSDICRQAGTARLDVAHDPSAQAHAEAAAIHTAAASASPAGSSEARAPPSLLSSTPAFLPGLSITEANMSVMSQAGLSTRPSSQARQDLSARDHRQISSGPLGSKALHAGPPVRLRPASLPSPYGTCELPLHQAQGGRSEPQMAVPEVLLGHKGTPPADCAAAGVGLREAHSWLTDSDIPHGLGMTQSSRGPSGHDDISMAGTRLAAQTQETRPVDPAEPRAPPTCIAYRDIPPACQAQPAAGNPGPVVCPTCHRTRPQMAKVPGSAHAASLLPGTPPVMGGDPTQGMLWGGSQPLSGQIILPQPALPELPPLEASPLSTQHAFEAATSSHGWVADSEGLPAQLSCGVVPVPDHPQPSAYPSYPGDVYDQVPSVDSGLGNMTGHADSEQLPQRLLGDAGYLVLEHDQQSVNSSAQRAIWETQRTHAGGQGSCGPAGTDRPGKALSRLRAARVQARRQAADAHPGACVDPVHAMSNRVMRPVSLTALDNGRSARVVHIQVL